MSQNNKLLENLGVPILNGYEKEMLRREWQGHTWDDMIKSLDKYGKYIMLRPTGFGKTYTSACACNIGFDAKDGKFVLNDGTVIDNKNILDIVNKKVIFVYVSEILRKTFDEYNVNNTIINGKDRIQYETYTSVALNWGKKEYLLNDLDIKNVGLVIFDEVQRMGALNTTKALDKAIKILDRLGIPYIGATATVERATGYDVCDKYFTHKNEDGSLVYCWGEHIYTLGNAFDKGLLIPPYYQYIEENEKLVKRDRHTRLSMLEQLKAEYVNSKDNKDKEAIFRTIQELEGAVIKNSGKIIHDSMMTLYDCGEQYIDNRETLSALPSGSIEKPKNLPSYMRFLVFAPDRASLTSDKSDGEGGVLKGLVEQTYLDFYKAFARYGYNIKNTVISSITTEEKNNVKYLDIDVDNISEEEMEKAVIKRDMTIDLVYSINMLNVGYHVENITGIIFKRWTASNQIYYQQLGRCLSANSDLIPIVFDFVNSIDDRGITAPLFTRLEPNKEITENADGTQNTLYTNKKNKNNKKTNYTYTDPRKCNVLEAKYVTVGMGEADIKKIMSRAQVYTNRRSARKLYEYCYNNYMKHIKVDGNKLVSDIRCIMSINSSLMQGIKQVYGDKSNIASINVKAYYEWLRDSNKELFIEYETFKRFLNGDNTGLASEYNSVIAMVNGGLHVKVLMNTKSFEEFKHNVAMQNKFKDMHISSSDFIKF